MSRMQQRPRWLGLCVGIRLGLWLSLCLAVIGQSACHDEPNRAQVQLGPRPAYLVNQLPPGPLKTRLQRCANNQAKPSRLSIAHRGAPLQFPEHTAQSYRAAAIMGAARIECDITTTADGALVCRHSQCDLHETTNILQTPLAASCRIPFQGANPEQQRKAGAQCCVSDISLAQFKSLCGRMASTNKSATTVDEYLNSAPAWRTTLYQQCGQLLSHNDSIALIDSLGADFIPELKPNLLPAPANGPSRQQLAQAVRDANIDPKRVWLQSFLWEDVGYWLSTAPKFAPQTTWLARNLKMTKDSDVVQVATAEMPSLPQAKSLGLTTVAPPLWALLRSDPNAPGELALTSYANDARGANLDIVAWTLERSGPLSPQSTHPFGYFRTMAGAIHSDADVYRVLDKLVQDVGVAGVFSDWPATVTYYDNCLNSSP